MLDAPMQGIAPGYGSLSEVGEPARRSEPRPSRPFSLLANPADDEPAAAPVPMSQSTTTWWEPPEPEPPPPPEPRPDDQPQLSPGDGSGFDPVGWAWDLAVGGAKAGAELGIEGAKAGVELGVEGAKAGIDLGVDAGKITLGLGQDASQFGLDAPEYVLDRADDLVEGAEWLFDEYVKSVELDLEMQEVQREVFLEALEEGGELTGDWFAKAQEFLGESTETLIETLENMYEAGCEGRERLHQALLGAYTAGAPGVDESERERFWAGLMGEATYDGENNPFRAEGVPLGGTRAVAAEWATDPLMIVVAISVRTAGAGGIPVALAQRIIDQDCNERLGI